MQRKTLKLFFRYSRVCVLCSVVWHVKCELWASSDFAESGAKGRHCIVGVRIFLFSLVWFFISFLVRSWKWSKGAAQYCWSEGSYSWKFSGTSKVNMGEDGTICPSNFRWTYFNQFPYLLLDFAISLGWHLIFWGLIDFNWTPPHCPSLIECGFWMVFMQITPSIPCSARRNDFTQENHWDFGNCPTTPPLKQPHSTSQRVY